LQNNTQQQENDISKDETQDSEQVPYLDTYQLSEPPFTSSIVQPSYYMDADRKQYLNHILHLVQSSDLVQVVVGDNGSGKSILVQKFIQQAGPGLRCCHIKASSGLDEHDLLAALAACLDLPDNINNSTMLELLWEQGFTLQRNDLVPVILIDDAHNLQANTLATLLQLQNINTVDEDDNGSPWRIILFTHPSHTLELMELNTRLHFIELTGLTEEQTAGYLLHRLRSAGLTQASPFSKKDIAFIHDHAEGNFHKIHQLAHQVLIEKKATPIKPVEAPTVKTPKAKIKSSVWISMLAVIVLLVVLIFQDKINNLVETSDNDLPITVSQNVELPEPQGYLLNKIPDPVPAKISVTKNTFKEKLKKPVIEPIITSTKETTVETNTPPIPQTLTPIVSVPAEKKPASNTKENDTKTTTKKPAAKKTTTNNPTIAHALDGLLEKHKIRGKQWILKQPAKSITAQMMASTSSKALIKLAENPALKGKTAIYRILRNNKDWYVLVYGSFDDKASLQQSLDKLPKVLRKNKPWIRLMAAVHAEIIAGKK